MPRVTVAVIVTAIILISECAATQSQYTSSHPLFHCLCITAVTALKRIQNILYPQQHAQQPLSSRYTPQQPISGGEQVQWLGHATTLITTSGFTILTDPVFEDFPGHRRYTPLGIPRNQLPNIDIIAISHNHYDHLNKDTLRTIVQNQDKQPLVVCPNGLASTISHCGYSYVEETNWWEMISYTVNNETIHMTCVPAHHWSGRTLWDINSTSWCGWVIDGTHRCYFAGDTAYNAQMFHEIGSRWSNIDIALLPIAPYHPYYCTRTQHMHATNLPTAIEALNAHRAIPIHWGTFKFGPEPIDAPQKQLHQMIQTNPYITNRVTPLTVGAAYTLAHTNSPDVPLHEYDSVYSSQLQSLSQYDQMQ